MSRTKKMTLVFTKSKKRVPILSRLIMWWTKKPYSHVAREVERRDWGKGYYQASEGNVNYEHESIFHKRHHVVGKYTLMVDVDLEMDIRRACWEDCGKSYGVTQNVGIFLIDIGLFTDNPWKWGRNCSELIYLFVLKKMIPELKYNPDTIKPHHIEDIIHKYFTEKGGVWELNR